MTEHWRREVAFENTCSAVGSGDDNARPGVLQLTLSDR